MRVCARVSSAMTTNENKIKKQSKNGSYVGLID